MTLTNLPSLNLISLLAIQTLKKIFLEKRRRKDSHLKIIVMKLHVSSSSHTIKMATTRGMVTLPNLNMNMNFSSSAYCYRDPKLSSSSLPLIAAAKFVLSHRNMICCAESPSAAASTVAAEKKEEKEGGPTTGTEKKEEKEGEPAAAAAKESTAPAKPKPPAKAPVKPLPEMMEEDVIPSLRSILEAQEDIKELNLFYEDNKVSPLISSQILSNQHTNTKSLVYITKLVVSETRTEPN
ncbi:hypothetical protein CTI12_AA432730 [Artemisia annua]|uniref:Uncharacterized protein n=1 Tax=Artemisia annua TaxID=35608 RepID=A0A2U1M133_ARTAN|nr:hypothetical protein CTI12_AA432730 [Artemisia annua]